MQISGADIRGSFFSLKPFRRSLRNFLAMLPIAFVGATVLPSAFASVPVDPTHFILGLTIAGDGNTETQDWSSQLSYDPASGVIQTANLGWNSANHVGDASTPWTSAGQFKVTGDVDPSMSYSFSAKNNTSSVLTYTFTYGESIVPPISGNYSLFSDFGGSLTRGSSSNSTQILPAFGDLDGDGINEIQTLRLSTDGGLTFFYNAGVDLGKGQSFNGPGLTTSLENASANITGNALSAVNYWEFDVSFTLTPGKDATALSGAAEITQIPEPSTYAGIMGAVALFGVAMRRRRLAV